MSSNLVDLASGTDDDIADMVFVYECLLCLVKSGEWIAERQQRIDFAPFNILHQGLDDLRWLDCCAGECEVVQVKGAEIKLNHWTCDGTGAGVATATRYNVD